MTMDHEMFIYIDMRLYYIFNSSVFILSSMLVISILEIYLVDTITIGG
jgi:hypothetical protein